MDKRYVDIMMHSKGNIVMCPYCGLEDDDYVDMVDDIDTVEITSSENKFQWFCYQCQCKFYRVWNDYNELLRIE